MALRGRWKAEEVDAGSNWPTAGGGVGDVALQVADVRQGRGGGLRRGSQTEAGRDAGGTRTKAAMASSARKKPRARVFEARRRPWQEAWRRSPASRGEGERRQGGRRALAWFPGPKEEGG
ncbi:hypothetical protein TRIUR3_22628 [Triticum urartu]|uniref:Uncharacterized protein n=1 Tax=Triticum urartu TaxID=4572 RepID=M7ZL75_TRIUA|nr:hypothetical protein TRIUR3_22628 [Triticum urartu]